MTSLRTTPEPDGRPLFLAECIAEYVAAARAMTMRDLRGSQYPPYSSVMFGAGGVAYALWRHDPLDPAVARWLTGAARCPDDEAWLTSAYPTTLAQRRQSLATGPAGLAWVRLLAATSAGRLRSARHWARVLTAAPDRDRPAELLLGTAGHLLALTVAANHAAASTVGPLVELEAAVDELRDRLTIAAVTGPAAGENIGFARGRLGVHHALLVAQRRRGQSPVAAELDALAALGVAVPGLHEQGDPMWRSWCNGVAGAVLTWVEAYRATGDAGWLDLARRDALPLTEPADEAVDPGNLCCGTGGWAQACLALDDVLPGEGWHDRALTLAVLAFEHFDSSWPHGLLRGYPGLVCLALDLTTDSPRGFPLVAA